MNTETALTPADEARLKEMGITREKQRNDAILTKELDRRDKEKRDAEEALARAENATRRTAEAQHHAEQLAALKLLGDNAGSSLPVFDANLSKWRLKRKQLAEYAALAAMSGDRLEQPETESELFARLNGIRRKAGMQRGVWLFTE
jgi:hypothetical protein